VRHIFDKRVCVCLNLNVILLFIVFILARKLQMRTKHVDDFSLDCLQYILSSLADMNAAD